MQKLGERVAIALQHRLADLEVASSVKDLVVGSPRLLDGSEREIMVVDLLNGHCLHFAANHVKNPVTPENQVDWARVTRIKIVRIVSNHE